MQEWLICLLFLVPMLLVSVPVSRMWDSEEVRRTLQKIPKAVLFLGEWIGSTIVILLFLRFASEWWYDCTFNIFYWVVGNIAGSIWLIYLIQMYRTFQDRLDLVFALVMIPVGIAFTFFMLPDYVPDEQAHFQRAYLVSNLNLKPLTNVSIDAEYGVRKLSDYKKIFTYCHFNFRPEYQVLEEAANYNFLVYVIPAVAIGLGRLLHLSVYTCYYMGRMANLAMFVVLMSYAIRIVPKGKKIFFVFCFNPMLIHLVASYSSDALVCSVCILTVANFLYLYQKEEISNWDIVITMTLFFVLAIIKYVYLPLFGIYFAVFPKLFRISKKGVLTLLGSITVGLLCLLAAMKLGAYAETPSVQLEYLEARSVDSTGQIWYLLEDGTRLFTMLRNTLKEYGQFYFESMIATLGWLDIVTGPVVQYGFVGLLTVSAFMESAKVRWINRIWMICIALMVGVLVILGLYLMWSPVGWMTSEGVQGRYFIPSLLLLPIALSNDLLKKIGYQQILMVGVIIINAVAMNGILQHFL